MEFGEVCFLSGVCIVCGLAMTFGGLLGIAIFAWFKKVMTDE